MKNQTSNEEFINKDKKTNFEGKNYYIKDGIVVIEKNAVIEANTVI